jgi:DNA-binding MarR family transcriptional regulator
MTIVNLFGSTDVTRDAMVKMPPHDRTICLALMRERGMSEQKIGRALGVTNETVRAVIEARHAYRSFGAEPLPPAQPVDAAQDGGTVPLPKNAIRLLRKIAVDRGLRAGKAKIAEILQVGPDAVDSAMSRLIKEDLIQRVEPGAGARPPLYMATPKGNQMAESILPLAKREA